MSWKPMQDLVTLEIRGWRRGNGSPVVEEGVLGGLKGEMGTSLFLNTMGIE